MSAQPKQQSKRGRAPKQGGKQQTTAEQQPAEAATAATAAAEDAVTAEADSSSSSSSSSSSAAPPSAPPAVSVSSVQVTDCPLPSSRRNSMSNPSAAPFALSPSSPAGGSVGVPVLFAPEEMQGFGAEAQFVGAIDQGTSSTRFILFDHSGRIVRSAQVEIEQLHPSDSSADAQDLSGWTEHDPMEIMRSIHACIDAVINAAPRAVLPAQIVALGLTNQRETSVIWDAQTGQPLHNAIVWHDARTAGVVAEMGARLSGGKDHFRASCGLPLSTYFSATKIKWMMDHVPAVQEAVKSQRARAGTVDSWIIWNLTSGGAGAAPPVFVTDVTNASRTMLMDLRSLRWHEGNCREFGIPLGMLPEIRSSSEVYGTVAQGALKGVRIAGCVGDQQAAMLGQLCLKSGQAKNTYGTGCFMLLNTGSTPVPSTHGLLTTLCFQLGPSAPAVYALEGSVAVAGSGVRWLRDQMQLIREASEIDPLARTERDAGDVYFVPAFSGLLSPYWRDDARGVIVGLTHASNRGHLARAVLHASAYQTREVLDAMTADTAAAGSPVALHSLRVDGGMAASDVLMQFQADQLSIPVVRPASLEATASGAAFCAGLAVGFWASTEALVGLAAKNRHVTTFKPSMDEQERAQLYRGWKKAVQRTFGWIEKKDAPASPASAASVSASSGPASSAAVSSPAQTPFIKLASVVPVPASAFPHAPSVSHAQAPGLLQSGVTAACAACTRGGLPRGSPVLSQLALLASGVIAGAAITAAFLQSKPRRA